MPGSSQCAAIALIAVTCRMQLFAHFMAAAVQQEPAAAPQPAGVAFDDFVVRAAPEPLRVGEPLLEAEGAGAPYANPSAAYAAAPWQSAWSQMPGAGRNGGPGGGDQEPGIRDPGWRPSAPQSAGQARPAAPQAAEQNAWPERPARGDTGGDRLGGGGRA